MTSALFTFLICATLTCAPAVQSTSGWVKYDSDEGRFSAWFPSQPKAVTQPSTTRTGAKLTTHILQAADASGSAYMVSFVDYPYTLDEKKSFDSIRDLALSRVKGTLLREYDVTIGRETVREFIASIKSNNSDLMAEGRIYVMGSRSYMLLYVYQKSFDPETAARNVGKFFDSFIGM